MSTDSSLNLSFTLILVVNVLQGECLVELLLSRLRHSYTLQSLYNSENLLFVRLVAVYIYQLISHFELLISVIYLIGSLIPNDTGMVIVGCGS